MGKKLQKHGFIKEIMKDFKGITLVETLLVLYINSVIILGSVIVCTLSINAGSAHKNKMSSVCEALMYIDYYINQCAEEFKVDKENEIELTLDNGKRKDIIKVTGGCLRIYYMNSPKADGEESYTYQAILYDVQKFFVEKKNNIVCIHIVTDDGIEVKKTIGKL